MHSTLPVGKEVPVFGQTAHVFWVVSCDRRVVTIFGDGIQMVGEVGVDDSIEDVLGDRPDLIGMFDRLLSGERVNETLEYNGALWRVEARPCYREGKVIGCAGISFALSFQPRKQKWKVTDLPQGRHPIREGDVFSKVEGVPGVAFARRYSDSEFMELMMAYGRNLAPVPTPQPETFRFPDLPPLTGRRRLRLEK